MDSHSTPTPAPSPRTPKPLEGKVVVYFGPMFSGKTSSMFTCVDRYKYGKRRTAIIKYAKDTRYSNQASSHDKRLREAIPLMSDDLMNFDPTPFEVIGIDEGQFFKDIAKIAERWANMGKVVIVAALDANFERKPFGSILDLVPLAEEVHKCVGVCDRCGNDASFTERTIKSTDLEVIGGAESYIAVCRACHPCKVGA